MEIPDETVVEVLRYLDARDEEDDGEASTLRTHVLDSVLGSLTEPQRELLDRWHSYVCGKCGHTMRTDRDSRAAGASKRKRR